MSNLGFYQLMTKFAKKVGGPVNLLLLVAGGGAIIGSGVTAAGLGIKEKVAANNEKKNIEMAANIIRTVQIEAQSKEGLLFKVRDQFRVLEVDGDAALIEKLGDNNNPYFVSAEFLKSISDYQ